jgi:hypothetical protein
VASFQQSINTSSAAIGSYFTNLNDFERQLYLDGLLLDPKQRLEATDEKGKPTPLLGGYFQPSSIKARTDSLTLLAVYGQRLSELAGSDAPQMFAENARILGDSLSNLDKTFSQLSNQGSDNTAASYVGPVSALVGSIGKMYLQQKKDDAIRVAVNSGAPEVRKIIDLLEKDLVAVVKPLLTTGLQAELAERVRYYNDYRQNGMGLQQRQEWLEDIRERSAAYDASVAFSPSSLMQSMRQALEALVTYANAPKTPQNFSDLVAALDTFSQNAQEIANEVQQIRQVTKGK